MSTTRVFVDASVNRVEQALLDAEVYPRWIIGTHECEAIHAPWPRAGGSFTYSIAAGPVEFRDLTTMVEHVPGRSVKLNIAINPIGELGVTIRFEPTDKGTRVTLEERPVRGPVRAMWNPLLDHLMHRRNEASLKRFCDLVEDRAVA